MDKQELKPCPFCGSPKTGWLDSHYMKYYYCEDCDMKWGMEQSYDTDFVKMKANARPARGDIEFAAMPTGYRAVAFRHPRNSEELFIDNEGKVSTTEDNYSGHMHLIIGIKES